VQVADARVRPADVRVRSTNVRVSSTDIRVRSTNDRVQREQCARGFHYNVLAQLMLRMKLFENTAGALGPVGDHEDCRR
jgi:hypothetical protein